MCQAQASLGPVMNDLVIRIAPQYTADQLTALVLIFLMLAGRTEYEVVGWRDVRMDPVISEKGKSVFIASDEEIEG